MAIGTVIYPHIDVLAALGDRMGHETLQRRLATQAERDAQHRWRQRGLRPYLHLGAWKNLAIRAGLHATGMYGRGHENFKAVQIQPNVVLLPQLPPAFQGTKILHLSDLHIDLDPSLTDIIIDCVSDIAYDLCVITGDFRAATSGSSARTVSETVRLAARLHKPVYAVLGNHDFVELVPPLEDAGIQFLLNETVTIRRGNDALYLSGIDDPHFYATDDLALTSRTIPPGATSILLSHTPDSYQEAAAYHYDLMLCGHTHAGQICLPGGLAVQRNTTCPRHMLQGAWRFGQMAGYTSSGVGATGVPIRFFCPPEIILHQLWDTESPTRIDPKRENLT